MSCREEVSVSFFALGILEPQTARHSLLKSRSLSSLALVQLVRKAFLPPFDIMIVLSLKAPLTHHFSSNYLAYYTRSRNCKYAALVISATSNLIFIGRFGLTIMKKRTRVENHMKCTPEFLAWQSL
jgi:hypothetical protein